jgi:hypothetical protein
MSLLKFKVSWNEDESTFRDIEILSAQSYYDLHEIIRKELQLPADMQASFYVSNDQWKKGKQISSTVEKNLRDAVALSMAKTPIGALIAEPHQKFLYECDHPKAWIFYVDLITLLPDPSITDLYPRCVKTEGISPSQIGVIPTQKDSVMEIEERYDLNSDEEGFGDEGEEETGTEEQDEESTEEFGAEDF